MVKYYLEHRGGDLLGSEHSKFYEIKETESGVVTFWGKTTQYNEPSENRSQTFELTEEVERKTKIQSVLKSKLKKGYIVISSEGINDNSPAAKKSSRNNSSANTLSTEGRRFGVEIETHSDLNINDIKSNMVSRGLETNLDLRYFKSNGQKWDIKRDSSCGYEFASPILSGDAGIFDAKVTVDKIQEICNEAVNDDCGLHVTVDISDFSNDDIKNLIIAYLKAQEFFYKQCNKTRQNNRYALRNKVENLNYLVQNKNLTSISRFIDLAGGDKYRGLNLGKILGQKVVEFRMMQSTINPLKLGKWIRLCVSFIDGVKVMDKKFITPKLFIENTFKEFIQGEF